MKNKVITIKDRNGRERLRYLQHIEEIDPERFTGFQPPVAIKLHELKSFLKHRKTVGQYGDIIEASDEIPNHKLKHHLGIPIMEPLRPKYKIVSSKTKPHHPPIMDPMRSPLKPVTHSFAPQDDDDLPIIEPESIPTPLPQLRDPQHEPQSEPQSDAEDDEVSENRDDNEEEDEEETEDEEEEEDDDFLNSPIPEPKSDPSDESFDESEVELESEEESQHIQRQKPTRRDSTRGKAIRKDKGRGYYANKDWYYGTDPVESFIVDEVLYSSDDSQDPLLEDDIDDRNRKQEKSKTRERGSRSSSSSSKRKKPRILIISDEEEDDSQLTTTLEVELKSELETQTKTETPPVESADDNTPSRVHLQSNQKKSKMKGLKRYKNGIVMLNKRKNTNIGSDSEGDEYDDIDNIRVSQNPVTDEIELPGPIDDESLIYRRHHGAFSPEQVAASTQHDPINLLSEVIGSPKRAKTRTPETAPAKSTNGELIQSGTDTSQVSNGSSVSQPSQESSIETPKLDLKTVQQRIAASKKRNNDEPQLFIKRKKPVQYTFKSFKDQHPTQSSLRPAQPAAQSEKMEHHDSLDYLFEGSQEPQSKEDETPEDSAVSNMDITNVSNSDHPKSLSNPIENSKPQDKRSTQEPPLPSKAVSANYQSTTLEKGLLDRKSSVLSSSSNQKPAVPLSKSHVESPVVPPINVSIQASSSENSSESPKLSELLKLYAAKQQTLQEKSKSQSSLPKSGIKPPNSHPKASVSSRPIVPIASRPNIPPTAKSTAASTIPSTLPSTSKPTPKPTPKPISKPTPQLTPKSTSQRSESKSQATPLQPTTSQTQRPKSLLFSENKLNFAKIANQKPRQTSDECSSIPATHKTRIRFGETRRCMFDLDRPTSVIAPKMKPSNEPAKTKTSFNKLLAEGRSNANKSETSLAPKAKLRPQPKKSILKPFTKPLITEEPVVNCFSLVPKVDEKTGKPPTPPVHPHGNSPKKDDKATTTTTESTTDSMNDLFVDPSSPLPASPKTQTEILSPLPVSANSKELSQSFLLGTSTEDKVSPVKIQSPRSESDYNPPQIRANHLFVDDSSFEESSDEENDTNDTNSRAKRDESVDEAEVKSSSESSSDSDSDDSDVEIIDEQEFNRLTAKSS